MLGTAANGSCDVDKIVQSTKQRPRIKLKKRGKKYFEKQDTGQGLRETRSDAVERKRERIKERKEPNYYVRLSRVETAQATRVHIIGCNYGLERKVKLSASNATV